MRTILRVILFLIKGVLLLIAVATLVMWPVSQGKWSRLIVGRHTVGSDEGVHRIFFGGFLDGRVEVRHHWNYFYGDKLPPWLHERARDDAKGWNWSWESVPYNWNDQGWRAIWGPVRWQEFKHEGSDSKYFLRQLAAPCWFIALVAGAWPLGSMVLALCRWNKCRRAVREGCCKRCGYDLRATKEQCPECGLAVEK